MTRRMHPHAVLDRIWARRMGTRPPRSIGTRPLLDKIARLAPYRWRGFHLRYARVVGCYWYPCALCEKPYGGHERGMRMSPPLGVNAGVCSQCTVAINLGPEL